MINKWYEVSCDNCGGAEHFLGTKRSANRQARDNGWIITKDEKYFDSKECYNKLK